MRGVLQMRPRIDYTESQKALMWERWQKGESLQQIAQLFDRNHSSDIAPLKHRVLQQNRSVGDCRPISRLPAHKQSDNVAAEIGSGADVPVRLKRGFAERRRHRLEGMADSRNLR